MIEALFSKKGYFKASEMGDSNSGKWEPTPDSWTIEPNW
jgi:hypothetical protein